MHFSMLHGKTKERETYPRPSQLNCKLHTDLSIMGIYESYTKTFTEVQCKPKTSVRKFLATKNNHQALANIFNDHAFLGISSSLHGDK